MLDANIIMVGMGVAGTIAFIARAISKDLGKLVALLGFLPFLIFVLSAISSGTTIRDPTNLSLWITAFVTNVIPIILIVFAEGVGEETARKFFG